MWLRNYKLFYLGSFTHVVVMSDERPELSTKWRISRVFLSINLLLATLCDTLIKIWENDWFLRLIWSFSEFVSENKFVFRICLWIIIHGNIWSVNLDKNTNRQIFQSDFCILFYVYYKSPLAMLLVISLHWNESEVLSNLLQW